MIRVGIVGCGRMGRERAKHIASFDGATLTVCADVDAARARELAGSVPGARAVAGTEPLPWNEIDALFVCTPPAEHCGTVERAAAIGLAVFVEKPLGAGSGDALRVAEALRRSPAVHAVGYMNRYRDGVRHARTLLERAPLVCISARWAGTRYAAAWWSQSERSGGPFNEQATHVVDLLRYLGGPIDDVRAIGSSTETRVAAAIRFEGGALATLLYSCEALEKSIGLDVVTECGHVRLEGWDFRIVENTIGGETSARANDPFETETHAFLEAVRTGDPSPIRSVADDAIETQRAVDAIRASANSVETLARTS
jgi:predicted dehydrogenase